MAQLITNTWNHIHKRIKLKWKLKKVLVTSGVTDTQTTLNKANQHTCSQMFQKVNVWLL